MSKTKFPITVKRGNVRVKIYFTPTNGCDGFTVAYYFGGKRQRKCFADLNKAKLEAETTATKIAEGEMNVLTLTSEDRTAYVRAVEMLKPIGTPLEIAVMQFVEAAKILGGSSLVEAAKFFAKQHSSKCPSIKVADVVKELIEAKEAEGLSEVYRRDLQFRLNRFANAFQTPISMILASEIQDYLRTLKGTEGSLKDKPLSARSKNNTRKALQVLFGFAQSRGYLPKGATEADELTRMKEPPKPIGIFKATEMERLLVHADEKVIPFLTIGAFAGLRHAEILRLDWSEVDVEGGHIEVKANKAKTASRRLVPIPDNLTEWLKDRRQETGRVVPQAQITQDVSKLAKAAKIKWPHNALRHSYISYRVAEIQNVAQVALEAGNSPNIIFSNYRELVKAAEAKKWFGITPGTIAQLKAKEEQEQAEKIVAMPVQAAA